MYLCHERELAEGSALGVDTEGRGQASVFVLRHAGQLRAWRDACPHHGTPLPWRKDAYFDASGQHVVCAAHGALFDPLTGGCTLGPCLGDALTPMPLHVADDGGLYLDANDIDPPLPNSKNHQETAS